MQVHDGHMPTGGLISEKNSNQSAECKPQLTFFDVINSVYLERGFFGFYQGLAPQLLNAVLKEGILNMIRLEILKTVKNIL